MIFVVDVVVRAAMVAGGEEPTGVAEAALFAFTCDEADEENPRNAVHFAPMTTGFLGATGPVGASVGVVA